VYLDNVTPVTLCVCNGAQLSFDLLATRVGQVSLPDAGLLSTLTNQA